MLLSGLLAALPADLAPICITGPLDRQIRAVTDHSQEVGPEDAFVAIRGARSDGHARVGGLSAAVFFTEYPVAVPEGATQVQLPSTRRALPHLCAAAAGSPARAMKVIGVTGTNGKTTTTFLLHSMTAACGLRSGLIGTTGNRIGDRLLPATHTTPDAARLQGLLREMQVSGVDIVAMEVSSIGLDSFRADAIPFAAAIFTNLSRDHLDYHGSMEAYAAAKARLFRELLAGRAILNCGDPAWEQMRPPADRPVWTFSGLDGGAAGATVADIRLESVRMGPEGTSGWLVTPLGSAPLQMRLIGAYNIENALGAIGAALATGLPLEGCLKGLAETPGAPGRLEPVPTDRGFSVRVDYAHTDDALARVLAELRRLGPRRILTVFGCGGGSGSGQASADGAGGGRRIRSGVRDLGQPAQRGSAGDHRGDPGRHPGRSRRGARRNNRRAGSARGDPRGDPRGAAGGHRADRREGTRGDSADRGGGAPV